ncbi:unnamed protein product [marine sediment metagenome]|uniref:Uncharacterized protein n=1 Tax=marine sediment metagenome TaxID=412755 RepID=X1B4S8_9ZZZZ
MNKVVLNYQDAQNLGAYLMDNSLARTFKLKPTSSPAKEPKLIVPPNYAKQNQLKFRNYQIIKGQRKPMKDKWIETKFNLLDTRAEVQNIQLRKALANLQTRSVKRRKAQRPKPQRRKKITEKMLRQPLRQAPKKQKQSSPFGNVFGDDILDMGDLFKI